MLCSFLFSFMRAKIDNRFRWRIKVYALYISSYKISDLP